MTLFIVVALLRFERLIFVSLLLLAAVLAIYIRESLLFWAVSCTVLYSEWYDRTTERPAMYNEAMTPCSHNLCLMFDDLLAETDVPLIVTIDYIVSSFSFYTSRRPDVPFIHSRTYDLRQRS